MKIKITLFIIYFFSFGFIHAQPIIQWQRCLGGSNDDQANSIQPTLDGGFIVAGESRSNDGDVTNNHGNNDYWIVKLDSAGLTQWEKCLGGLYNDFANSIQLTIDSGFIVTGYSNSNDGDVSDNNGNGDVWVVKLNSTGIIEWQKCIGGSDFENSFSIQQTMDNGYIVVGITGSIDGDVVGNHGNNDAWVVKLNSNGVIQWQSCLGGSGWESANSIIQTVDGGYVVAGLAGSSDGDITGYHGGGDCWIMKLDSGGALQWNKCFGGTNHDEATSIKQTNDGGYIVGGYSDSWQADGLGNHGGYDFLIIKLNDVGVIQWKRCLGGWGYEKSNSIIQTTDDGYIAAGYSVSNEENVSGNHGLSDYWIIKLDSLGIIQWQKSYGGSADEVANSIRQVGSGYIIAGYTESNDDDASGNHGTKDAWVIKIIPTNTDLGTIASTIQPNLYFSQAPFLITGKVKNYGLDTITSFTMNYRINGDTIVSGNINSVQIIPLATYTFTHPVGWIPSTNGTYSIDMWACNLNGSTDQDTSNDHFLFDVNVLDTFAIRNTCIEMFTATWCIPCAQGDFITDTIIGLNRNNFTIIKYHWNDGSWTSNEEINRSSYYNVSSIPKFNFDGQLPLSSIPVDSNFCNYQSILSFMTIDISPLTYSDTTLYVNGIIMPLINYDTGAYYYQVVVTEKEKHTQFPSSNGETVFRNKMVKMFPNDTGTYIPSLIANTPIIFNQAIAIPCCNVESMDSLRVVVFVQNNNDKKIQQSAWKDVTAATSVTNMDNKAEGIEVYPNPSNKYVTVITNEEKGELNLYDFLGKEVLQKSVEHEKQITLNISFLPSGIYFLRMNSSKGIYSLKIIKE
jgi:hypothetical protein